MQNGLCAKDSGLPQVTRTRKKKRRVETVPEKLQRVHALITQISVIPFQCHITWHQPCLKVVCPPQLVPFRLDIRCNHLAHLIVVILR